jgi:hypothetical protein
MSKATFQQLLRRQVCKSQEPAQTQQQKPSGHAPATALLSLLVEEYEEPDEIEAWLPERRTLAAGGPLGGD